MTSTAVAAASRGAEYAQVMRERMLGGVAVCDDAGMFVILPGYCANTVSVSVAASVRAPEKSNSEQRLRA